MGSVSRQSSTIRRSRDGPRIAGVSLAPVPEFVRDFGRSFFERVRHQAYGLVCGGEAEDTEERKRIVEAFGFGIGAVGSAVTAILVTHLGIAPAVAAVVLTLIVKLFFNEAHGAMCETWKKHLRRNR